MSNRNYRLSSPIIIDTITSTGTLTIDTGGSFALNIGGANAVSIALGHSGMTTTSLGPLTVNQDASFLGTNFTVDSSNINLGDANTDIINTIAAVGTNVPFGAVGSTSSFSIYALQQSNALSNGSQMTYTSGKGGNGSGSNAGGYGGATTLSAASGGNGTSSALPGAGGIVQIFGGDAGTNGSFGAAVGGDIAIYGGYGSDGSGSHPGAASGGITISSRFGGAGTSSAAGGASANVNIKTAIGGFNGGGGGGQTGNIILLTGDGQTGTSASNAQNAGTVTISGGTGGASGGSSSVAAYGGYISLYSGAGGAGSGSQPGGSGGAITMNGGGGGPGGTASGGTAGGGGVFDWQAGSGGINEGYGGAPGGYVRIRSGPGSNALGTQAGQPSGPIYLNAYQGGEGNATAAAGDGGDVQISGGNAGGANGGTGGNGGSTYVYAGTETGSGTRGTVVIGGHGDGIHWDNVTISGTNFTTTVAGKLNINNHLGIDGYSQFAYDVGFNYTTAITQFNDGVTGANLRLRKLRFFSDNVPLNQAPQNIYATGGDLVLSSPGQNIMIDAPEMYWSQNANIYTGGFNLQIGPAQNYLVTNYGVTNTVVGYDLVATGNGASTGNNTVFRLQDTTNYTGSGVDLKTAYINVINNTNDGYSGTTTGLHIDVGTGTNTSFSKTSLKQKAHAAYTGSEYITTTASVQTTNSTQTTAWSYTLADNTLYWVDASVIGRDSAGTERAMYGKRVLVYRQSAGSATIQGSVQNTHSDVETSAGLDATFTVNSNDVRLSVTGLSSTTINWVATVKYQAVSTNT